MREHALHVRHDSRLARLLESWAYRDERYAFNREAMSAETEAAVRAQRRAEVERLPYEDRANALYVLNRWSPPSPQRQTGPFLPAIRLAH